MKDMKKQLVIIKIVAILVCVGLSGCTESNNIIKHEKNRFVGTWQNTTSNYTTTMNFSSNGTCFFGNLSGTWDLQDGQIVFNLQRPPFPIIYTYKYIFSNNNGTLSLTSSVSNYTQVFSKL